MQMCLFTRSLKQKRGVFTFENACTYHANKLWILIYRKQVLLQSILYINEFIPSYCLQNKYICIEILLEVYFLQHTILNWQKTQ